MMIIKLHIEHTRQGFAWTTDVRGVRLIPWSGSLLSRGQASGLEPSDIAARTVGRAALRAQASTIIGEGA